MGYYSSKERGFNPELPFQIPYLFRFSADQPERCRQYGEEQRFIGMVPKVLEVFGVDENNEKGNAELAGNIIIAF